MNLEKGTVLVHVESGRRDVIVYVDFDNDLVYLFNTPEPLDFWDLEFWKEANYLEAKAIFIPRCF